MLIANTNVIFLYRFLKRSNKELLIDKLTLDYLTVNFLEFYKY